MNYRIRIIEPNGNVKVLDKSHSQICEYLADISSETFRKFLAGIEITAPNGDAVKFVRYV